ncbi:MAG: hypothetical protein JSU87_00320 [Gemmatimonadota bacterium]|nr:MAG: hypothetical protein JSU87_00320 [Gemmatimonadota bacterium]
MTRLQVKLALMFIGAPLALVSGNLGQSWLFFAGLALLGVALLLPARPGVKLGERLGHLIRHLPLVGWLRRRH